jgi:hypothetical protein
VSATAKENLKFIAHKTMSERKQHEPADPLMDGE